MRLVEPGTAGTGGSGPGFGDRLSDELRGLDALELPVSVPRDRIRAVVATVWPKATAVAIALAAWQAIVLSGWKPDYVLPGPGPVLAELVDELRDGALLAAVEVTLRRAALGYAIAIAVGTALGVLVARWLLLRAAIGSLITGLQTMPSIAWFPLAILAFQRSEAAILFVVVLGAAPSIANGVIGGIDQVPPVLSRAGRVIGARGLAAYRYVILPAALPTFVGGLKQGWAFCWRSLMAGELLVIVAGQPSIGVRLQFARELSDAPALLSMMLVILAIGIAVDSLVFTSVERSIRSRRGLIETS